LTDEIADKGAAIIPEVKYEDLFEMGKEKKEEPKKRGCFVVRGTVSKEKATTWLRNLKGYYTDNKTNISGKYICRLQIFDLQRWELKCATGWPEETPFVLKLYWSPTQLAPHSHPNRLRIQHELNSWWHDSTVSPTTSPDPLTYVDAVRIRPPGIPFMGLGPHIDAGSICR
jgi:hypothetical protein